LNGELSVKKSSSNIKLRSWPGWLEVLFLLGIGAVAVIAQARFRIPIQLHGRHGMVWMALLIVGRAGSNLRWASTISSLGAMALTPLAIWGFGDPFIWLTYFLVGPVLDILYNLAKPFQGRLWFLMLLGAFAHITKPLARSVITLATGYQYASLQGGLLPLLVFYILFGLIGGLVGGMVVLATRRGR
jgi:hypothetical protein